MKYSKDLHMILWNFTEQHAHNPEGRLTTVEETRALLDEIDRLTAELAELKSENVTKNKKLTDYENELQRSQNYNRTCQTCRYLDESRECVLGNRCVNYALWQRRIL